MSALDIVACASPLLPAATLAVTLYGPWHATIVPPLQFFTLVGETVLAAAAHHTVAQAIAAGGFLIALMGLAAIVLRDRWIEHRARTIIDWERFERAFASYLASGHADGHPDDSHRHT